MRKIKQETPAPQIIPFHRTPQREKHKHRTPYGLRSPQHRKLRFYSPHHRNTANPHVPLCYVVPCRAMLLCYVVLCCALWCYVVLCRAIYLTIIPLARVGYDSYPTSTNGIIVLLKTPQNIEKSTKLRKESAKNHAFAYHTCRVWYNGSYIMMAKPMKTLQLHYPMIQFLISYLILCHVVLFFAMLWYVALCCVIFCYVLLFCAMLCYIVLCLQL